jgi:glutamine synthetase adenylyltransferase
MRDTPSMLDEIRRLQKTHALLIAVQFAANHEVEFDVSDALAVIVVLVTQSIAGLDRLEALQ